VSARHQVKRLDRISEERSFKRGSSFKTGPAEETSFSSFGAGILNYPQFHRRQKPGMKSGPDVFADALVPSGRIRPRNARFCWSAPIADAKVSGAEIFPNSYRSFVGPVASLPLVATGASSLAEFGFRRAVIRPNGRRSRMMPDHLLEPGMMRRVAGPTASNDDAELAAMVIVLRNRRVNRISRLVTSPCAAGISAISRAAA